MALTGTLGVMDRTPYSCLTTADRTDGAMTRRYWFLVGIACVCLCLLFFALLVFAGFIWSETVCENGMGVPC